MKTLNKIAGLEIVNYNKKFDYDKDVIKQMIKNIENSLLEETISMGISDTLKGLYNDGDERIYEVISMITDKELNDAMNTLTRENLAENYGLIQFLESQLEYTKQLDRELENADE